jgi:spermine/spermidine synthase
VSARELTPARAGLIAFLVAFLTLAAQVLVHRMVAVKLVNNFVFLVISLTMLGFAVSGVAITRWQAALQERRRDVMVAAGALFALTLLGAAAAFYHAPSPDQLSMARWATSRQGYLAAFLLCMPLALLFAVPFVFCGLILGLLLSAPDLPVRRIYALDLAGSALGAFAVIPAITALGVERAALLAGLLMAAGTAALAGSRSRLALGLTVAAALATAMAALAEKRVFDMRYPSNSVLGMARDPASGFVLEHVAWDPVARIEVSRIPPPTPDTVPWPYLVGDDPAFLALFKRILTQNNTAFTYAVEYDGRPPSLKGIERTLYAAAYPGLSVRHPRVLVIGVGGGFDVLTALSFDASEVTAVEVNRATVDLLTRTYRDYFRAWVGDPRVRLVQAEGRHFLASTDKSFDVIQLSGVDTAAGTPAAAHVFSESYIYSAEAFDLYLSRLGPDGILNMMRQEYRPPREMLRALATAVGALRRAGVRHPATHVLTVTARDGLFTALLVKRTPFTEEERGRVSDWARSSPFFELSAAPEMNAGRRNLYQAFLSLDDPAREAAFVRLYPFDVRPAVDDRPFFFKYSYWSHLFSRDPVVRGSVPVMEMSLLVLLVLVSAVAAACVLLPLRHLARGGIRAPGAARFGAFFACIGVGYLAIEMALLQKFGLFLGHPNYALSVVLAALLLATGLGALFSGGIARTLGGVRVLALAVAAVVIGERLLLLPRLPALIGLPFAARASIVCGLVAPLGLLLGTFFPTALSRLKGEAAPFAPWAWGINGVFSVVAPLLSVGVSMTWGIDALLLCAVPFYLVAGLVLPDPPRSGSA